VLHPWSAFDGSYGNMNNWPPHTYNNPDTCNNIQGYAPKCNLNDTISGAKNRDATYKVRLFNDAYYSGAYQTIYPLTSVTQVAYNDRISSLCWNAGDSMQLLARRVTAVVITAAIGVVSFGVATSVVAQSRVQPAGVGGAAPTGAASDASAAVEELKLGQVTDVRVGSDIVFPSTLPNVARGSECGLPG
jgi:hypothetical protein